MTTVAAETDRAPVDQLLDDGRLAVMPQWVLDADVSDRAIRLYGMLACYRQSSGSRMPSLSTLARRLRAPEPADVDVALHELAAVGAVRIQVRTYGRGRLISSYEMRTVRPTGFAIASNPPEHGSSGESRRESASLAMSPGAIEPIWSVCGIADWAAFVEKCRRTRSLIGQSADRWTGAGLAAALRIAVCERDRPAGVAPAALLLLAGDMDTRSPMRLVEPGPWWDTPITEDGPPTVDGQVLAAERRLADVGGLRVSLQQRAREQLASEGLPVTRATVATRALALLEESQSHVAS
jgi:hypothetical protein